MNYGDREIADMESKLFSNIGAEIVINTENKKTERNVRGVKFIQPKIKFEYSAPEAKEVSLVGNFNQWNSQANPMKKDKKGIWKVTLSLEPGRYEYRFIVDGNWVNNPSCSSCVAYDFGGEICVRIVA
jgi:1,4-alpha-glucan branching enzyme